MRYSIVVISKGRHTMLVQCLKKLKEIKTSPQIVVVEAVDHPEPLGLDGIRYITIPEREAGFSHQRNIGVAHAEGDYIVFADDDIEITPQWYEHLTGVMDENPGLIGVMGAVFPLKPTMIGFCEGVLGHPGGGFKFHHLAKTNLIPLSQVATCNTIIKKTAIQDAGGFDLRNKYGSEDSDLTIRITKKFGPDQFRYAPKALVYHLPRNRFSKIIPWYIRRGKADADLFLKHTTHLPYLLKTSLLIKVLPFVFISYFWPSPGILAGVFFFWYLMQLRRTAFMFDYFHYYDFPRHKQMMTYFIFPFVKFTADLMFDWGRLLRITQRHGR